MNKILRITFFVLGFFLSAIAVFTLIPDQFNTSYQRVLVKQYDYYQSTNNTSNRLIFVGNSSLSFGFDIDKMEELSGRKSVIIGNHGGYGLSTPMEMAKSGLNEGDIVVIEFANNSITTCGSELLLTGMGKRVDLYRFFIPQVRQAIIDEFPLYLKKNFNYWIIGGYDPGDEYSTTSYDERGNMIFLREGPGETPDPYTEEDAADITPITIESEFLEYLTEYVSYCEGKGVKVYFTVAPLFDEGILNKDTMEEDLNKWNETLQNQLPAPLISDMNNYVFSRDKVWLAHGNGTHLNTDGSKIRTEKLYNDLAPYLN